MGGLLAKLCFTLQGTGSKSEGEYTMNMHWMYPRADILQAASPTRLKTATVSFADIQCIFVRDIFPTCTLSASTQAGMQTNGGTLCKNNFLVLR